MISAWTKNCKTQDEKDKLSNSILGSKTTLNRLSEILEEEVNKINRSEMDPKTYESANWAALQAHKNGYRSAMATVQSLINLDQKD